MDTEKFYAGCGVVSDWIDRADSDAHLSATRVMKCAEEAGEACAAYLGMVGTNPRKGVTNGRAELLDELADTALAAIEAIHHFTQDPDATRAVVENRLAFVLDRAGLA